MTQNKGLIVFSVGEKGMSIDNKVDMKSIERICMIISNLVNVGYKIVLVSAGSILLGMKKMGFKNYPDNISFGQALASLGQVEMINTYQRIFDEYNKNVAQLLITREIMNSHTRVKNAKNTLHKLLSMDYLPIINENDTVSVEDIQLKDNFPLASVIANLLHANYLVVKKGLDNDYLLFEQNDDNFNEYSNENELYEFFYSSGELIHDFKAKSFPMSLKL